MGGGGDYWIVQLGPETYGPEGLYQYSIVSDPSGESLFVLARNATDFKINYDAEILQYLDKLGFNTLINKPRATVQDGCKPVFNTDEYSL